MGGFLFPDLLGDGLPGGDALRQVAQIEKALHFFKLRLADGLFLRHQLLQAGKVTGAGGHLPVQFGRPLLQRGNLALNPGVLLFLPISEFQAAGAGARGPGGLFLPAVPGRAVPGGSLLLRQRVLLQIFAVRALKLCDPAVPLKGEQPPGGLVQKIPVVRDRYHNPGNCCR